MCNLISFNKLIIFSKRRKQQLLAMKTKHQEESERRQIELEKVELEKIEQRKQQKKDITKYIGIFLNHISIIHKSSY